MSGEPKIRNWGRMVVILAIALLAMTHFRAPGAGMNLAIGERGVSFSMSAAFVSLAFEFGHKCSDSNSCGLLG